MKKTYQRLTAGISAIILCISSSVCIVSADTMITQPYIPEGIEVAPPDNIDTTETVVDVDLNVICDSLREFATDKAAVFVAKKEGFVIFSSENQKESYQAKAYCEENKIDSKYVFFILSEEEILKVVDYIKDDESVIYDEKAESMIEKGSSDSSSSSGYDPNEKDELLQSEKEVSYGENFIFKVNVSAIYFLTFAKTSSMLPALRK